MIYLDHNATTPVLPEVLAAMQPFLMEDWGNPSSVYRFGSRAKAAVESARASVAALLDAEINEVVFTSCATEANNTAIHSALLSNPAKRHIVTSQVEHSSVQHYCEELVRRGYEVTFLPVSRDGLVDLAQLERTIRPETAIVSLMWANNETGVISPVHEIVEICDRLGVIYHCDAVQAVGKLPVSFADLPIHFLTFSGHKIGAPKGIGALLVRAGLPFHPLIVGGKQEAGRRGGTEGVPLVVALGEACRVAQTVSLGAWMRVSHLRDEFEAAIFRRSLGAYRNGIAEGRLPNTSNIGFPGVDNDALVTYCDNNGVCISAGSACIDSALSPSHVIQAMTRSHDQASEAIRVSLGLNTSPEELSILVDLLVRFADLHTSASVP